MGKHIKITSTKVETVEKIDWTKTLCLKIDYKIAWYNWNCNIIDFEDNEYNKKKVIEKVKKEIRKVYNNLTVENLLSKEINHDWIKEK